MKVRAQVGMVMALDKCIGCHTCSVTCKQVWTNRPGAEYMWFNDVETKPGLGYPKRWEDQEKWRGGWELDRKGRLRLKAGGRLKKLAQIFYNPELPELDDYYEPWTYDYEKLITSPLSAHDPVARARSQITGREMDAIRWGPNWDDNLAGTYERIDQDPLMAGLQEQVKATYEQAFMFYLPRICEHCLNPSCVASCPSDGVGGFVLSPASDIGVGGEGGRQALTRIINVELTLGHRMEALLMYLEVTSRSQRRIHNLRSIFAPKGNPSFCCGGHSG